MDTGLSACTLWVIEGDAAGRKVHVSLAGTQQLGGSLATQIKTKREGVLFRPRGKTLETCSMRECRMSVSGAVWVQYEHRLQVDYSRSRRINIARIQLVTKYRRKSPDFLGRHFRDC